MMDTAMMEMPRYKCHKEVHALKIAELKSTATPDQESDGSLLMVPADTRYAPFVLDAAYTSKHRPKAGGYYVVYADGYKSYSPAEAFEDGYSLCE
jgi:hypothetical protein